MKATTEQLVDLKRRIAEAVAESPLSRAEIGEFCCVHASQVSRICRGDFKTVSHNVVQVCKVLGVETETVKVKEPGQGQLAQRLASSLLGIWVRTPADAERLVRFLNNLADLRGPSKSDVP